MDNRVNCWNPLRAETPQRDPQGWARRFENVSDWAISSQAAGRPVEGPTTRARSLFETVKPHECAAPHAGEDIVCAAGKPADVELKCSAITSQNTGANVVGACFIRGDSNPGSTCFGGVMTRDVSVKFDEKIKDRQYEIMMSAKWGVGEVADESGCKIVTDA